MFRNLEDVQKYGKEQAEAMTSAFTLLNKGLRDIATESTNYSKKSLEASTVYVEKCLSAKSFDAALQIQTDFTATIYKDFMDEANKLSALCSGLAKEMMKSSAFSNPVKVPEPTTAPLDLSGSKPAEAPVARAPTLTAAPVDFAASRPQAPIVRTPIRTGQPIGIISTKPAEPVVPSMSASAPPSDDLAAQQSVG